MHTDGTWEQYSHGLVGSDKVSPLLDLSDSALAEDLSVVLSQIDAEAPATQSWAGTGLTCVHNPAQDPFLPVAFFATDERPLGHSTRYRPFSYFALSGGGLRPNYIVRRRTAFLSNAASCLTSIILDVWEDQ